MRTTPEAIDLQRVFREMLDAGDRSCAMEASSHASVLHRLDRVRFAVLVFTNLSQDHLDFHGDMESYFEAKRQLFLAEPRPIAVVNVGDEYGRRLAQGQYTETCTWFMWLAVGDPRSANSRQPSAERTGVQMCWRHRMS